jgi:SAM-dependent MidA family methyltransferase
MITSDGSYDNPQLKAAIIEAIQTSPERHITFERFMEMALYHPEEGYYTRRAGLIGPKGDFYTAPRLTPVFGELVGKQIAEFWERLGSPSKFRVVEMGAGQGLLAGDILTRLQAGYPALWAALRYTIVEISEPLRQAQRHHLEVMPGGADRIGKVDWCTLAELGPGEIEGCFISNELLDAFPVHLITVKDGQWRELYVALDTDNHHFKEEVGPLSDPALAAYFAALKLNSAKYEDGYRTEVNLRMFNWLEDVTQALGKGYVLTIDYGYPATQRYHPLRREGSLQCYSSHRVHDNPYINIGWQDITSHVDFTGLQQHGEKLGLTTLGLTKQAPFLLGLGLGEKLAGIKGRNLTYHDPAARQHLAERNALQTLINPSGMGNFGILFQALNLPPGAEKLSGLALTL